MKLLILSLAAVSLWAQDAKTEPPKPEPIKLQEPAKDDIINWLRARLELAEAQKTACEAPAKIQQAAMQLTKPGVCALTLDANGLPVCKPAEPAK